MSGKGKTKKGVKTNVISSKSITFETYRNEVRYKSPKNVSKKTADQIRKWQAGIGRRIIGIINGQAA